MGGRRGKMRRRMRGWGWGGGGGGGDAGGGGRGGRRRGMSGHVHILSQAGLNNKKNSTNFAGGRAVQCLGLRRPSSGSRIVESGPGSVGAIALPTIGLHSLKLSVFQARVKLIPLYRSLPIPPYLSLPSLPSTYPSPSRPCGAVRDAVLVRGAPARQAVEGRTPEI